MKKRNAADLWNRYQQNQVTDEEKAIVESWYNTINGPAPSHKQQMHAMKQVAGRLSLKSTGTKVIKLWSGIAAAVVLILAGLYIFQLYSSHRFNQHPPYAVYIKPGTNTAYLTLSNGKKIVLTGNVQGVLASQSGMQITAAAGGQLVYHIQAQATTASGTASTNTLTTPRGGQYQVVLPDGTHVWLNAASSLTYPATFIGKERRVQLKGEAYFEVAKIKIKHDGRVAAMPFIVQTGKEEVRVLGTHFNVNAYADETTEKTTLLEGSVSVRAAGRAAVIKPGEQTILSGSSFEVNTVDVDQEIAWKNGLFSFKKADIQTMMRQISRWYNVEVAYEGKIPDDLFVGKIQRTANIADVLRIFSFSNIHYRIEGRKIIIKK